MGQTFVATQRKTFVLPPSMSPTLPSIDTIRQKTLDAFGVRPCTWQCQTALALLQEKDVMSIAPTGAGKTMTFWMPLLFKEDGIVVVITPLNILGSLNQKKLEQMGIAAINSGEHTGM